MGWKEDLTRKANYLSTTKSQIRDAIINKGIDVPANTPFSQYSNLIRDILWWAKTQTLNVIVDMAHSKDPAWSNSYGFSKVIVHGDTELDGANRFNFFGGIKLAGHWGRAYRLPLTEEIPEELRTHVNEAKTKYANSINGRWNHLMISYKTPNLYINFLMPTFYIQQPDELNMNSESPLVMTELIRVTKNPNTGYSTITVYSGNLYTTGNLQEVGSIIYCDIPLWCNGKMIWPNNPAQKFPYRERSSAL